GLELSASWNQALNDDWTINVGANVTTIKNNVEFLVNDGYQILQDASRTVVGYPIGYFYGYVHDGIYQSEADIANSPENTLRGVIPGDIRFKDVNNDGQVDINDRTMIGNPTPDFTYGASIGV